jgi:hypothetical protein
MHSFAHPHRRGPAGSSVPFGDHTKVQFAEGFTGVVILSLGSGHCVRIRRDGEDSDRPRWLWAAPHFLIDVNGPVWVMRVDRNRRTTALPWAPPLTWFINSQIGGSDLPVLFQCSKNGIGERAWEQFVG